MNGCTAYPWTLGRLLEGFASTPLAADCPITGLCADSRAVEPGDLFLALRGFRHHGLEFLEDVRRAGAAAVAWEPPFPETRPPDPGPSPLVAVEDLGRRQGLIAARFYGQPSRDLELVGITGTDGKTSCAHFLAQASGHEGRPCGLLGTLGYGVFGRLEPAHHTTPDALTLQAWLARLRDQGAKRVAMEVSSHALDQERVAGLRFTVAVLTQLSRDHLDYHGSLEAYAAAKRRLFVSPGLGAAVLNLDDPFGRTLATELRGRTPVVGYGLGRRPDLAVDHWVGGRELRLSEAGLSLIVDSSWGEGELHSPLLGRFNAGNLLAVLAALVLLGQPFASALERLGRISPVPGRMERVGTRAVVDYAHTPHALEQVLAALREHTRGKLWCVFGCGGDRDPGKRPLMGAIAERLADRVIVTDDNPRSEDPEAIAQHVLEGMARPEQAQRTGDRRAAIHQALGATARGDMVLVAGKGHEDYQLLGEQRLPFSDRAVILDWLEDRT